MAVLRLIRFPNLIIVAFTQCLLYYCIILPALQVQHISPDLDPNHFHLFIFVTLIITAGGYIINDILDFETDLINKPDKVFIQKQIPLRAVYWLYALIHLIGLALSIYLALRVDDIRLAAIFPAAVLGLFAYSKYLKGHTILGNAVVAAYCAGVAWIIWFSQKEALGELEIKAPELHQKGQIITWWYILFAFLSTFFRELVKDIEDIDGDRKSGLRTAPIAWGIPVAKGLAFFFGSLLLIAVSVLSVQFLYFFQTPGKAFLFIGLLLPITIALVLLFRASTKMDYHRLSQLAKWVMAAGAMLLLFLKL